MKNILFFFAFIVFVGSLSSCAKKKSEVISGKWKVSESEFAGNKLVGDFHSAWYRFNADSTFEKSSEGKTETGVWLLDEEKNLLHLDFNGNEERRLEVKLSEFSEDKLKMDWEEYTMKYSETLVPAE